MSCDAVANLAELCVHAGARQSLHKRIRSALSQSTDDPWQASHCICGSHSLTEIGCFKDLASLSLVPEPCCNITQAAVDTRWRRVVTLHQRQLIHDGVLL